MKRSDVIIGRSYQGGSADGVRTVLDILPPVALRISDEHWSLVYADYPSARVKYRDETGTSYGYGATVEAIMWTSLAAMARWAQAKVTLS